MMWEMASEFAIVFGLPGTWIDVDVTHIRFLLRIPARSPGCPIRCGLFFDEMELQYNAGFTVIPDPVKFACVQLVRNAQAMPALNVKEGALNAMHFAYFADTLLDSTVPRDAGPLCRAEGGVTWHRTSLDSIPGHACAAKRLADALLRSMGNTQLRCGSPILRAGDTNSQLGLEAPVAQDLQVSPAAVKSLEPAEDGTRRIEVIVSITALQAIAKVYQVEDIAAWLRTFEGVVWHGNLMRIAPLTVDRFLGADCLFHLTATE